MKVKIVRSNYPTPGIPNLNLNNYIGEVFPVHSKCDNGMMRVDFGCGIGVINVYEGEYEIVEDDSETQKRLDNYMRHYQRKYNFCNDDVVDFLLEHRGNIVDILK